MSFTGLLQSSRVIRPTPGSCPCTAAARTTVLRLLIPAMCVVSAGFKVMSWKFIKISALIVLVLTFGTVRAFYILFRDDMIYTRAIRQKPVEVKCLEDVKE